MRFLLLADLHFGRADPDLLPSLFAAIEASAPDLVVVAGDFVQRTWRSQYAQARDFLERLEQPWMAVPGNHDIPLFNLPMRLAAPRFCYRRWIAGETEPRIDTPDIVFRGIDTTERLHHQRGRIDAKQIREVAELIAAEHARRLVVLVAHHPFHQRSDVEKKLMLGAPRALAAWAEAGPHVIVTGHLHTFLIEPFVARPGSAGQTLQIHCGTGLSTRLRGEPNEFAIVDGRPTGLIARRMVAAADASFTEKARFSYRKTPGGWTRD